MASMRPRRVRRGNAGPPPAPDSPQRPASMRPRRVRRGNTRARLRPPQRSPRFNEAPACPPGKSAGVSRRVDRHPVASMRPRRVRRGNLGHDPNLPRRLLAASMRPRRVRRGNPPPAPNTSRLRPGFNEAPACPPGKSSRRRRPSGSGSSRFNEAPACPPGKCDPDMDLFDGAAFASMRPRRVRRGNPPRPSAPRTRAPRFNEAPACPPGKWVGLPDTHGEGRVASMRPRRVRRGNLPGPRRHVKPISTLQ